MKNVKFDMKLQFYLRNGMGPKFRPCFGVGFSVFFGRPVLIFMEKTRAFCASWDTFVAIYRDFGILGHRFVAIYVIPVPWVTDLSLFT